jgi:hypothetical protein
MNDPLIAAILAAGQELASEHHWCFDGDIGPGPTEENEFVIVLLKHLRPITNTGAFMVARRAALVAELEAIDAAQGGKSDG